MSGYVIMCQQEVEGEINLWKACIRQHLSDLLLPPSKSAHNQARVFFFGGNEILEDVSMWLNIDLIKLRRRIIISYRKIKQSREPLQRSAIKKDIDNILASLEINKNIYA